MNIPTLVAFVAWLADKSYLTTILGRLTLADWIASNPATAISWASVVIFTVLAIWFSSQPGESQYLVQNLAWAWVIPMLIVVWAKTSEYRNEDQGKLLLPFVAGVLITLVAKRRSRVIRG